MKLRQQRVRLLSQYRPPGVEVGKTAPHDCGRLTAFRLDGEPWCEPCWWASPQGAVFRQRLARALATAREED